MFQEKLKQKIERPKIDVAKMCAMKIEHENN